MKQIGVTETYDPCFVPDLESKLLDANIIITKELTDDLVEILRRNNHRVLLHHTITGAGGSIIEPGLKNWIHELSQLSRALMDKVLPPEQVVLRVDPIIPFIPTIVREVYFLLDEYKKLTKSRKVWDSEYLPRVRVSMIDMYPHVRKRFEDAGIEAPYDTFHAPQEYFDKIEELLWRFKDDFIFESCAESKFSDKFIFRTGCVSAFDLSMMGQIDTEYELRLNGTRKGCTCLVKKQILGVKPGRCPHSCLYCYWKDE